MNFHPGGDLVLRQAGAEFNYCLLSGRRFSLEEEIKERELDTNRRTSWFSGGGI